MRRVTLLMALVLAGCGAAEPSPSASEPVIEATPTPVPTPEPVLSRPLSSQEVRVWLAEKERYEALCAPLFPVLDDSEQGFYCTADPLTPTEPPS